jgi:methylthioribose-1-phosphate isomerase
MRIHGRHYRTIWTQDNHVTVIDQTRLPHAFTTCDLSTLDEACHAIQSMIVRGAPLIGITAAYGVWLAMQVSSDDQALEEALTRLGQTRPTAVNLHWALAQMAKVLRPTPASERVARAKMKADRLADDDVACCHAIGIEGLSLIRALHQEKLKAGQNPCVNILTHCNAGWLATVDWGTALAPIYLAHDEGIKVHVYVDETRPRNQGASLSAYELHAHGVPHTILVDNAGGHLMQHKEIDMCIVGADRVTSCGDAANKIGTYLKALAAKDNDIPFYFAVPSSTIDWTLSDGLRDIPIEERNPDEVTHMTGATENGPIARIQISSPGSAALNPAFDVTPARLITAIITERGIVSANRTALASLFPELAS